MTPAQAIIAFENTPIRRNFDEATETWYFSVIDVIAVLTESLNPRDYWFKMKTRVQAEDGIQLSTICRQLKYDTSRRLMFFITLNEQKKKSYVLSRTHHYQS